MAPEPGSEHAASHPQHEPTEPDEESDEESGEVPPEPDIDDNGSADGSGIAPEMVNEPELDDDRRR